MNVPIFISYSHQDAHLVMPIVRLLRATKDLVFLDTDSIQPGKKWREEIYTAVETAKLVVLFWCTHSGQSPEVKQEYELAMTRKTDLLPVLLDSYPVPDHLAEYQWIDFRELVGETHEGDSEPPLRAPMYPAPASLPPPPEKSLGRTRQFGVILGIMLLMGLGWFFSWESAPGVSWVVVGSLILGTTGLLFLVTYFLRRYYKSLPHGDQIVTQKPEAPDDISGRKVAVGKGVQECQLEMATKLRLAILTRTGLIPTKD